MALVEAATLSDGIVTEGEQAEIRKLAAALGDDCYRDLLEQVDERFPDLDKLKAFLATVDNTEARNLIYGTILEETMASPSVAGVKVDLLDWMSNAWDIKETQM